MAQFCKLTYNISENLAINCHKPASQHYCFGLPSWKGGGSFIQCTLYYIKCVVFLLDWPLGDTIWPIFADIDNVISVSLCCESLKEDIVSFEKYSSFWEFP